MQTLTEYHRPADLSTALALLQRKTPRTVPLAGGTWLTPRIGKDVPAEAVVDLSRLGLDQIERDPDTLRMGPMATLASVVADETCRNLAGGILAETVRRDATVNVRNLATVGGTVAVAPADSEFILALLALAAELSIQTKETRLWPLSRFLQDPAKALDGGLITQVRIHLPLFATGGISRLVRTPADHAIVAAVAVVTEDADAMRIAVGGVAPRPLVVEPARSEEAEAAVDHAIARAQPYADFLGSVEYRQAMGALMAKRALQGIGY